MKKSVLIPLLVVLISLAPLVYLAIIWDSIPETVTLHFNEKLQPDRVGPKSELWIPGLILSGVPIIIYLLMKNIHIYDPKRAKKPVSSSFIKLSLVLVVFFSLLNFVIIYSALHGGAVLNLLLFPLIGLLFVFVGNYTTSIKPNYFAGYRLPWTLNDDENWRKTHMLAGKLWFLGGCLFFLLSFFFPSEWMFSLMIGMILILIIVPSVYSFTLFRKKIQQNRAEG